MKKLLCLVLSAVMLLSFVSVVHADETAQVIPEKVEISFKVGDSTLMINGTPVTVETPYVVGAGTTLVPLRVITEAFGAKVTWVDATKEIILEYPDVNITLQIGNTNATVNSHTETLPEAPVLSPNGVTMVPLRFISETFGATVGYDNATAAITVVKENTAEESTISSSTDLPRIGDSYWKWSMLTPSGMMMTDRLSDGSYTLFADENVSAIEINIYDISEEEESLFDEDFDYMKNSYFAGYTLSKAEKGTDAFGNKTMEIIARTKEDYVHYRGIYTDTTCYDVYGYTEPASEMLASITTVVESFKLEFAADEAEKASTHDLSNVGEDGYRVIEDEDLKVSFKVPAACIDQDPTELNLIWFASGKENDCTEITLGIYSKSEGVTAKSVAEEDSKRRMSYYSEEFCAVSAVHPYSTTDLGENAYYYWMTTDGLIGGDYEFYDIYFEKGDYVYNITITVPEGDKEVYNTIIASLETEELNSEETGVFLRNNLSAADKSTSAGDWSMTLPGTWVELAAPTDEMGGYMSVNATATLVFQKGDAGELKNSQLRAYVADQCEALAKDGTITEKVSDVKLGTRTYYTFQVCNEFEEEGYAAYSTAYVGLFGGDLYVFVLTESQEHVNSQTRTEVEAMISSLELD